MNAICCATLLASKCVALDPCSPTGLNLPLLAANAEFRDQNSSVLPGCSAAADDLARNLGHGTASSGVSLRPDSDFLRGLRPCVPL